MQPEPATADDPRSLLRQACEELRRRLLAGEDCQAEHLFAAYPALASDPDLALALIRTEWQARQDAGRQLPADQWQARFPQWSDHFERWLPGDAPSYGSTADGKVTLPAAGETPPQSLAPVQSLDHHVLEGQIGEGGMGTVYRAWDPVLKRHVALKKIRVGVLAGAGEVERFYREARAAAQLRHPNVVPIYGMGLHRGEHCFTMALAPDTLEKQKKRYQADVRAAVALVEAVARGVQAAHDKNIVHRDLKPANILLDDKGQPLVADFGLAKLCDAGAGETLPGVVMGTAAYMAPEQAAGRTWEVGKASDVWALGGILYELLTGRRPFEGDKARDILPRVLHEEPPRPRALKQTLNGALEEIVLRCLNKSPTSRYPSAAGLAEDLARWLRGESLPPRPTPRTDRSDGRHRWSQLVLAAVILGGTLLLVNQESSPPHRPVSPAPERGTRPLVLVDVQGLRVRPRRLTKDGTLVARQDGSVRVGAPKGIALFQFLDKVPRDRYQVRAEVMDLPGNSGGLGIFVSLCTRETGQSAELWFAALTFSERPTIVSGQAKPSKKAKAMLSLYRHLEPTRGIPGFSYSGAGGGDRLFSPAARRWRRLSIQVTPELIRAYWGTDLAPFAHFDRDVQLKANRQFLASLMPAAHEGIPRFPPSGGLGFFCKQGVALFRNVAVIPLPAD